MAGDLPLQQRADTTAPPGGRLSGGSYHRERLCPADTAPQDESISDTILCTRGMRTGRLRALWNSQGRIDRAQIEFLCHGIVLQPDDVRRVYGVGNDGAFSGLS